jgi:hypothetical protein
MATVPIRPRTVKPACPKTALLLCVNGVPYQVLRLDADKVLALVAYRLTKPNGEFHDVALTPAFGPECSCASWVFDHANLDGRCKHVAALEDWGLLRAPDRPRPPVIPLPPAPGPRSRPAAAELEEVLAGMPPAEPMTPEGIAEMADWFLAEEALRSATCHVCKGKRVDAFGGDCVGCGGVGVVPAA